MEYKKVIEHRSELMGIALITIILFHWGSVHKYYDAYNFVSGIFSSYIGSIGVDVFLFLSGVGIYSSLQRNSLHVYFKNRVTRILPAYLSIGGDFGL